MLQRTPLLIALAIALAIAGATIYKQTRLDRKDVLGGPDTQARTHQADASAASNAGSAASSTRIDPVAARAIEVRNSNATQAEAPQTYIGPDGKEHQIVYNQGLNLDKDEVRQLRAEVLKDMRAHPDAFVRLYGLELEDVQAIASGKREFPEELLAQITR